MPPSVTVAGLLNSRPEATGLPLELLSGRAGLQRLIASPHIQKTGLALAGFHEYLQPQRILVFGESEVSYLESLSAGARSGTLAAALAYDIPCVLITGGFAPPSELIVPPSNLPITARRPSCWNSICSVIHCVPIRLLFSLGVTVW